MYEITFDWGLICDFFHRFEALCSLILSYCKGSFKNYVMQLGAVEGEDQKVSIFELHYLSTSPLQGFQLT